MAEENKIEDVERVEIAPAGGETVDPPETDEEAGGEEGDAPEEGASGPKEKLVVHSKPEKPEGEKQEDGEEKKPAPVEGESPRETALRLETERLRGLLRKERTDELGLGGKDAPAATKKEPSARKAELLKKYKPEEIAALEEVLPVLAEDLGYVRTEQLNATQYSEKSEEILQDFIKEHPEYSPENDKGGLLWGRFKEGFSMYKQPQNPNDFKKIFNRIHTDIFGIKPIGDKGALNAAKEKIKVASHSGASGPTRNVITPTRKANAAGLRLDMLKGFSEEEVAQMAGEEE